MMSHDDDLARGAQRAANLLDMLADDAIFTAALALQTLGQVYVEALTDRGVTTAEALASAQGIMIRSAGIE